MKHHIKSWAGQPLEPTTFERCLHTHFLFSAADDSTKKARRLYSVAAYLKAGATHGPLLKRLGVSRFEYLGWGGDGFTMLARAINNDAVVVKLTSGRMRRPRHPHIVPVLFREKPRRGQTYGLEILPITETAGIKTDDVLDTAVALAKTGYWVEDLNEENIGRYNGTLAAFDVGSGVYTRKKQPRRFAGSILLFTSRKWDNPDDPRLRLLDRIAMGKSRLAPRPKKPAKLRLPQPQKTPKTA